MGAGYAFELPVDVLPERGVLLRLGMGRLELGRAFRAGWAAGREVGLEVGRMLGRDVGRDLGWAVGRVVGLDVGRAVGLEVGRDVGRAVGREVGRWLGRAVGREVGLELGLAEGLGRGLALGRALGLGRECCRGRAWERWVETTEAMAGGAMASEVISALFCAWLWVPRAQSARVNQVMWRRAFFMTETPKEWTAGEGANRVPLNHEP